jgi:hypothetical protein
MIIDAMTTAHRNEYFRNLLEHQRLTLESVTKQRDRLAEALREIANEDYRGSRPWSADIAHKALEAVKGDQP